MTRYGPQTCPSTRRGAPGRGGYPADAPPVEVASLNPVNGSTPAVSRHDAHRPSGASGDSCRPHRGQRRDSWVTVSDITSPGSSEARFGRSSASARVRVPRELQRDVSPKRRSREGGHLDQTEPSPGVTHSTPG